MTDVHILAIDLAKRSFQICATAAGGAVLFNRMISRAKLETVPREQTPCIVAMEACATSHFWGRFAQGLGHEVRLIPPIYVKPFVKRQKNDAADAAAIAEAALRPNLHFVAVKSAEHQARAVAFRTHQSFVGQRTQLINALRGDLGEFGLVVAQGPTGLKTVAGMIDDNATELPDAVRDIVRLYLDQIAVLTQKIDDLHFKLRAAIKVDDAMRRLCTVPGVGPVTAGAIMAFAPDLRAFASGRNFAAWLGLVPRQRSTGGKTRLGGVSKMGQADIRKLLIVGAMSRIRWIIRRGVLPDSWLGRILGRKPRMVAAVALANKMARMTGGDSAFRRGHEVKLIAPRYVKPFVKRQKKDADAEAIVIAAQRQKCVSSSPSLRSSKAVPSCFALENGWPASCDTSRREASTASVKLGRPTTAANAERYALSARAQAF